LEVARSQMPSSTMVLVSGCRVKVGAFVTVQAAATTPLPAMQDNDRIKLSLHCVYSAVVHALLLSFHSV